MDKQLIDQLIPLAKEMAAAGFDVQHISTELNIPPSTIFDWVLDLDAVAEAYTSSSMTTPDICAKFKITPPKLYSILRTRGIALRRETLAAKNSHRELDPELAAGRQAQIEHAIQLYLEGQTIRSIVQITALPQPTLHAELSRRGVPLRQPKTRRWTPTPKSALPPMPSDLQARIAALRTQPPQEST